MHTTTLHLQTKESVHIHQPPYPSQRVGSGNEITLSLEKCPLTLVRIPSYDKLFILIRNFS